MAEAMPEVREIPDQPRARGLTFEQRVAELEQITTLGTATEIASIEYGYGGDIVALAPDDESPDGQPVDAG